MVEINVRPQNGTSLISQYERNAAEKTWIRFSNGYEGISCRVNLRQG